MKDKINLLFKTKKNNILNVYCTAGFPHLNSTMEVLQALQQHGADIIEIGMPYSDPLADGEVIQQSSAVALQNGMSIEVLFNQLHNLRKSLSSGGVGEALPVILMGYMNPILQFGMEKFCAAAKSVGISGVILPDLPMHEYETIYKKMFDEAGLDFIFLITPETSDKRIRKIDELGSGFIYAVSSSSTTGNNKAIEDQEYYFKKLQAMNLKNPILVGFGIKDKATFDAASKYTNGAIIGSAYIKALQRGEDINTTTKDFINNING